MNLLTQLFEQLANVIDRQEALVETHYAPGSMLTLIERLQRECDQLVARILASFAVATDLPRKLQTLASAPGAGSVAATASSLAAPLAAAFLSASGIGSSADGTAAANSPITASFLREADAVITDLAALSHKTVVYERFLRDRLLVRLRRCEGARCDRDLTVAPPAPVHA